MKITRWIMLVFVSLTAVAAAETGGTTPAPVSVTHHMMLLMSQLGIIIVAAKLGGLIFHRLKLPDVLGELCAGMVIGPFMLGSMPMPGLPGGFFPRLEGFPLSMELYGICSLAAIILLFIVGLECDLKLFLRYSLAGTAVGIGGVVGSFFLGALTMSLFGEYAFGTPLRFFDPPCLFLGVLSTATSVGITARILSERRKLVSPEGVTILAGAVIDDVLGIIALAVVLGAISASHDSGGIAWGRIGIIAAKAIGIWVVSTFLGILLSHRISALLKWFRDQTSIAIMALGFALILAGLFEEAGLAMIIGAYVAGLSLSQTDISRVIQEKLEPVQRLLVPIFFCCMGMLVDFHAMGSRQTIIFGLIFSLVAILAKMVGCGLPALFFGFNLRGALRIAVGMVPRGEVALIIAGIGLAWGVLGPQAFGVAIMMTILTTLSAPILLVWQFSNPASGSKRAAAEAADRVHLSFAFPSEELSEVLLGRLLKAFSNDGFYVHALSHGDDELFELRQDNMIIELRREGVRIVFDCDQDDEHMINAAVFEITTDLRQSLDELNKPIDQKALSRQFARSVEIKTKRTFDLAAHIPLDCIIPRLKASNAEGVLNELLDRLVAKGYITDKTPILKSLLERELIISTGLQDGFALPHARTPQVSKVICAVGVHQKGLDYKALDGKPSHLFVLELAPQDAAGPHLQFVAALSNTVRHQGDSRIFQNLSADGIHRLLTHPPQA